VTIIGEPTGTILRDCWYFVVEEYSIVKLLAAAAGVGSVAIAVLVAAAVVGSVVLSLWL
jgi:hypothetical protein